MLNLASSELMEDNLLHQFKAAGYRMIFFGDDTWLKLFPNAFHRFDGVSSFFVSDFTEVSFHSGKNSGNFMDQHMSEQDNGLLLVYVSF